MADNRSGYLESSTYYYANSTEYHEEYHYEQFMIFYQFRKNLCTFVFVPVILLGHVGNIMSFVTWGKMINQNAVTFLLRTLAIIDSCILLCSMFRMFTHKSATMFYVDDWFYTAADMLWPYTWAYVFPLTHIASLANILTSMCIGLNRYIVVCKPFHATRLCTVSRAKTQVICIILVSILVLLPSFFAIKVQTTRDGSPYIVNTLSNNKLYYYIYEIGCHIVCGSLVPFGILLFFCVRIIMTLRAARRQPIDRHGDRLQETRVTSMVLVLLGVFILCHIYWWIHLFCVFFLPDTFYYQMWKNYSLSCAEFLVILNSSVNWVIYSMYINEFRKTLCQRCCHPSQANEEFELS